MMNKDQVSSESIDQKLGVVINLLAYQIVENKTLAESAPILKRLGLKDSEIASIFGSTRNAVSVRLAEAKKRKTKK